MIPSSTPGWRQTATDYAGDEFLCLVIAGAYSLCRVGDAAELVLENFYGCDL